MELNDDAVAAPITHKVLAAVQTYGTGSFVPPDGFSQSRLEGTYLAHMATIAENRLTDTPNAEANAKAFHKIMHQLYLNAS
ncbi:hypothetical protein B0H14DRAFT_3423375 [Mycena olivaceomarginata]|nr:hypothetical protein B0H14DRAFT_3423375 [Mycena olivaceomarginata]